jgi:integrase
MNRKVRASIADQIPRRIPGNILPVHAVRQEDSQVIESWIASRQGTVPIAAENVLYSHSSEVGLLIPTVFISPKTMADARSTLHSFCRRSRVSLREVGLVGDPGELATFEHGALRREIVLYAQDYEQRMIRRIGSDGMDELARAASSPPDNDAPLFLRTSAWGKFVRHARDLFDWMEIERLRPPGSNPLAGIRIVSALSRSSSNITISMSAYRALLASARLTAMERAVFFLLANGLRAGEVARLKISDLDLVRSRAYIVNTANDVRTVPILPWTMAAMNDWFTARRWSAAPWLFPGRNGRPFSRPSVFDVVRRASQRILPSPEHDKIAEYITPQGFRGYFAIVARRRGMNPIVIMNVLGLLSERALSRYVGADYM